MIRRKVKVVLLCEDSQQESFARRFLVRAGWHPRALRVEKSPQGRGAGEKWVRDRFPEELESLRRRHVLALLVAMVDADRATVEERLGAFDQACHRAGIRERGPDEPVALFVPRRNIETWLSYLSGKDIDEESVYPKLDRARECAEHVRTLKAMCDAGTLRDPSPPSLQVACVEYRARTRIVEGWPAGPKRHLGAS